MHDLKTKRMKSNLIYSKNNKILSHTSWEASHSSLLTVKYSPVVRSKGVPRRQSHRRSGL